MVPFELSPTLHSWLIRDKHPVIVHVASMAGLLDVQTGSPDRMAKAGSILQTKSLTAEWVRDGVRIKALTPWFTGKPRINSLLLRETKVDEILRRTPLKLVARAEERITILVFLAMNQSSYFAGQTSLLVGVWVPRHCLPAWLGHPFEIFLLVHSCNERKKIITPHSHN